MNTFKKLALSIALVASFQIGCGDDTTETPKDSDNNTDNGSDDDAGADGDTDSDTGAGSDNEGEAVALTADADGNIETNDLGITGTWFTYGDMDNSGDTPVGASTITGSLSGNGGYCAEGEGAEVTDADGDGSVNYEVNWGAGIGFNLCLDGGGDGTDDDVINTIATCPSDLSGLVGFRLTVTGEIPSTELRVTMAEKGRDESTYIKATVLDTPVDYLFADATVGYDASAPEILIDDISALQIQVSTKVGASVPFNFCIEDIAALTAK